MSTQDAAPAEARAGSDVLDILVVPLAISATPPERPSGTLQDVDPEAISAGTVFCGVRRIIVHNDAHAPGRQRSNVGHELSHGLLLHPPTPALDDRGCRRWDPTIEEADILAGVLLLPQEACIATARQGASDAQAALAFGTSQDASLGEQLLHVSVRQPEPEVPAHGQQDHIGRETEPGEGRAWDGTAA